MNLEGMSKKELMDLVIELAASLKEEDLYDPETYSLVGQLLDILDDSGYSIPQEVIDQLSQIQDPKARFIQAVQMLGAHDESQLDRIAGSLKEVGLLKNEDGIQSLIKTAPIDVTNSHILMFPATLNAEKDKTLPPAHVTLKWLGTDKDMDHKEVQKIVDKYKLHPPKPTRLVPTTWKSPRGDIHVLALQGDHDNLHAAHEELSQDKQSIHPFVPHITVSKELHDSIPAEGIEPDKLGLHIGPLEYRVGHQTMKQFQPATQATEHYTKPVELYENHPIHNELQSPEHYRSALKVSDQGNDFKKSDAINRAQALAQEYAESKGLSLNNELPVHKVDPIRAKKIADAYAQMPHNPQHPDVKAAYDALIKETVDQFKFLKQKGLNYSRIEPGQDNPYKKGSSALRDDINNNHHIWYFPTDQGFGNEGASQQKHPMLQPTGEFHNGHELLANDVFRIVHDYFGHSKEGHTFGPHGEDNAWKAHMQMYSPLARKALTTETRGQNSWVNYGPHGEQNRKQPESTIYADQKAGLLPPFAMEHEHLQAPMAEEHFTKPAAPTQAPASAGQKPTKLAASELARQAQKVLRKHRGSSNTKTRR